MSGRFEIFSKEFSAGVPEGAPAVAYPSLTGSAAAFAAAALAARGRCAVLAVVSGFPEADAIMSDLRAIAGETGVEALEFPPLAGGDRSAFPARLKVSATLGSRGGGSPPLVVVAPVLALRDGVPPFESVQRWEIAVSLEGGGQPGFAELQSRLLAAGYSREPEVSSPGEFSVRGGVLDVWSPDAERPVRTEYFGDVPESIREFDPATQISTGKIPSARFMPVSRPGTAVAEDAPKSVFSILPPGSCVMLLDYGDYAGEMDVLARSGMGIGKNAGFRTVYTGDPAPAGVPVSKFVTSPLPGFSGRRVSDTVIIDRVKDALSKFLEAGRRRGALVVEDDSLTCGFSCEGLAIAARCDRFPGAGGRPRESARRGATAVSGERLESAMDIEPGELVVHVDYGIGRFLGSTEVEVGGERGEVFTIEYADGAKLHVPVAHAHLLSRYVGVKGETVRLHRLDGKRWAGDKKAAGKAVRDLAAALLETQAKRAVAPGFAYDVEADGVAEFEAAFPYEETPDQAKAIADVKRDLASAKPMDRLVCGDAGYGKTEIAMRAAFIAAANGRQTAVLAPTTVLAQQHYETFLSRFGNTAVRIEAMSRFQSRDEKSGAAARLESGASDIVIGTHALLSPRVRFRDLGLIIIDEEQRFGVRHKEALKRLRATADVLTMSATPIPRTLYLSIIGARDLSVLKTPPRERVATETVVRRDTDSLVESAIASELARGGQVYFLHNRVATMSKALKRLKALCPEAKIDVAHGQMPPSTLAEKMRRFADGRTDVLLCTTIVESGLDIPRANTILVDRADTFGIAEMYQLRGRVGRGSRQGYAYFLLPEEGLVDSEARERLDAIRKHTGSGSGYNLSLRDLELRGAGNLLGREQSGHIAAIGFTLYCRLLRRTVAKMKGEAVPDAIDVTLNLDFIDYSPGSADAESGASLPYDYVEEEAQRMDFHRRLAETATLDEVRRLKKELADRYGRLPPAAARLVDIAELRVVCAGKRVARVDATGRKAVFRSVGSRDPSFVGRMEGETADEKIASLFRLAESL